MLLKLIACNVFLREACACIAQTPHPVDADFIELGQHIHSETLRNTIQSRIDAAENCGKRYDAILLLYGICGNAGVGLCARGTRLVIPRAHDCCTILLGSKARFVELFGDAPSTPFSSAGYMERGNYYLRVDEGDGRIHYGDAFAAYVEQYGEDNAKYIWETLHPPLANDAHRKPVFIDLAETSHLGHAERFRQKCVEEGKECTLVEGSIRLIRNMILGQWDADDFLIVEPGRKTAGVYDFSEVLRAKDI